MKDTTNQTFTAETALAFFTRHLDGLKWEYHHHAERPALLSEYSCAAGQRDFTMHAHETNSGLYLLLVNSRIPWQPAAVAR
jgi:hypothetical protein